MRFRSKYGRFKAGTVRIIHKAIIRLILRSSIRIILRMIKDDSRNIFSVNCKNKS